MLQALFNLSKSRSQWWPRIIPLLCKLSSSLPSSFTPSQVQSHKCALKGIYLFLLRMPGMKPHRNILANSLGSLDCKPEIIQNAVRIADKASSLPDEVEQEREPAQKRSRPPASHDEDLEEPERKARKLTHEATPVVQQAPAVVPSVPAPLAVPQLVVQPPPPVQGKHPTSYYSYTLEIPVTYIDTPLGRFSNFELADRVLSTLMQSNLPMYSNVPIPNLRSSSYNPYPGVLIPLLGIIHPNERMYLQQILSQIPPQIAPMYTPPTTTGYLQPTAPAPVPTSTDMAIDSYPYDDMDDDELEMVEPKPKADVVKSEEQEDYKDMMQLASQFKLKAKILSSEDRELLSFGVSFNNIKPY